ncbi:RasGEF domain-containing protein [Candidatus Berkiella aquae]|uniref:Protein kinase n=1 Tax=Candidatus Berkiella aquae TaxID=295108 RepID=A0A0Q9YSK4_9GAMM|nr:RasGEF domain-containing protein [Candidatus Berkiella aquae]MCS5710721.1 protein kinase [Candidatus Berkiella aquae]
MEGGTISLEQISNELAVFAATLTDDDAKEDVNSAQLDVEGLITNASDEQAYASLVEILQKLAVHLGNSQVREKGNELLARVKASTSLAEGMESEAEEKSEEKTSAAKKQVTFSQKPPEVRKIKMIGKWKAPSIGDENSPPIESRRKGRYSVEEMENKEAVVDNTEAALSDDVIQAAEAFLENPEAHKVEKLKEFLTLVAPKVGEENLYGIVRVPNGTYKVTEYSTMATITLTKDEVVDLAQKQKSAKSSTDISNRSQTTSSISVASNTNAAVKTDAQSKNKTDKNLRKRRSNALKNVFGRIRRKSTAAKSATDLNTGTANKNTAVNPSTLTMPSATGQNQVPIQTTKKPAKIEKRFGSHLLNVNPIDFKAADEYFSAHPDAVKIKKGTVLTTTDELMQEKQITLNCSMIRPRENKVIYALANGEYLGEGAYGIVKIAQNQQGQTFAIKIEGKGKKADDTAESKITKFIGYLKATETRKLEESKDYRGVSTDEKSYTIMQLRQGKEIFEHLYTNVLTAGQLYTKDDQDQKRRQDETALSEEQKLIIAYKSCQAVNDLHLRGVIHGDIKPANLMANVKGQQIVVAAIDFGFSFQFDLSKIPPDPIAHAGAPEGTDPRYMPPEVRVANPRSPEYKVGEMAQFSPASDCYSLGVMFEDDMQLSSEITQGLKNSDPNKRDTLLKTMGHIVAQLEKIPEQSRTPEINKVIHEHHHGVKRFKEQEGPKEQATFISQLMSGFRDPRESVGDAVNATSYTTDDYDNMAIGMYDVLTPPEFYADLEKSYSELNSPEEQAIYKHNAMILLKALLKVDVNHEYLEKNKKGIEQFSKNLSAEQASELKLLISAQNNKAKSIPQPTTSDTSTLVDIDDFIDSKLKDPAQQDNIASIAAMFADDLQAHHANLFKAVSPLELQIKKIDNDKQRSLAINQMTDSYNFLSAKVVHDIIHATSKEHQQAIYTFYINLMESCLKRGDYLSASAIQGGLTNTAVERLKYLTNNVNEQASIARASKLFNPEGSSKNLRESMQARIASGMEVIPLPSVLIKDLINVAEIPKISETTKKVSGTRVQIVGHLIKTAIVENQDRIGETTSQPKTNIKSVLATTVQPLGNYYNYTLEFFPRGKTEPDFSKVKSKQNTADDINAAHAEAVKKMDVLKQEISVVMQELKTEHAKESPDISKLIELRKSLKKIHESITGLLNVEKNNLKIVSDARKIPFDEAVIKENDALIKSLLVAKIEQYFKDEIKDDTEISNLYDQASNLEIYRDLNFTDSMKPFVTAISNKRTLMFLQGNDNDNDKIDPAEVILERSLKEYAKALVQVQSANKTPNDEQFLAAKKDQIEEIVGRIKTAMQSDDATLKAAGDRVNDKIQGMITAYTAIKQHLESQATVQPKQPVKKGFARKIKSIPRKIRGLRNKKQKSLPKEETKDLLSLINHLRDETQRRTRDISNQEVTKPKNVTFAETDDIITNDRTVHVSPTDRSDDEVSEVEREENAVATVDTRATTQNEPETQVLEVETTTLTEPELQSIQPSITAPTEPKPHVEEARTTIRTEPETHVQTSRKRDHGAAFSNEALALAGCLEHLSDPSAKVSQQFRSDAMRQSVDALKQLPKDMKPKNFADIVSMASTDIDNRNINEVTRKVATETIMAVIIPPYATLNQLKQIEKDLASRVSSLKLTDPMTQQIAGKIAIREAVMQHVKASILEKTADHQARPSALRPSVGAHSTPTLGEGMAKPQLAQEPEPLDLPKIKRTQHKT